MLDELSQWIRQIVMVVMFATFVDFFIPENNFLKYVKVILGLLVMMVIINPLIPLFRKDINVSDISFIQEKSIDYNNIISNVDRLNENINKLTLAEYKVNVEKYIYENISELTPYDVRNVKVKIDENFSSPDFGKINEIKITLSKNPLNQSIGRNVNQEKITIDRVIIDYNLLETSVSTGEPKEEFKELMNYLTETFYIPEERIFISLEE